VRQAVAAGKHRGFEDAEYIEALQAFLLNAAP
jgi:hypothetical protein